jgi:hypothetical protein
VGVAAKVPTAKPPTAPMAAPMRNFVIPSRNGKFLPALPYLTEASLA